MKLIRWIIAIVVLSVWAALIGTSLYVAMYSPTDEVPEGAAIVALAGIESSVPSPLVNVIV